MLFAYVLILYLIIFNVKNSWKSFLVLPKKGYAIAKLLNFNEKVGK